VSIFLDANELKSAGVTLTPDRRILKTLVKRELTYHGEKPWKRTELDVFMGMDGSLLVIARPAPA